MQEAIRKKGRPRPADTIARDTSIELLLYINRSLREISYLEQLTSSQTYHALRRLQRAGRVTTVRNGRRHYWSRTQTPHA